MDEPQGQIYEIDGRFYYTCKFCETTFSGSNDFSIEAKGESHEFDCELRNSD